MLFGMTPTFPGFIILKEKSVLKMEKIDRETLDSLLEGLGSDEARASLLYRLFEVGRLESPKPYESILALQMTRFEEQGNYNEALRLANMLGEAEKVAFYKRLLEIVEPKEGHTPRESER
jgi:hypothetical protein